MVSSRLVVFLMICEGMLYKTTQFKNPIYVGDPLNTVKIFNDLEVDELVIVDASKGDSDIDYALLYDLASVSRMPICYGGKVRTKEQFQRIVAMGFEKVLINTEAIINPSLIRSVSGIFGKQSVVVGIDVYKNAKSGRYDVYTHGGTQKNAASLSEIIQKSVESGAGEILINNIFCDGMETGYDTNLLRKVSLICPVPLTFLGGLSSVKDIQFVSNEIGPIGIAGSSFFIFKGKFKAVLPHYIDYTVKLELLS